MDDLSDLRGKLERNLKRGLRIAGANLLAAQSARIHERGQASDGSKLSPYSTTPYYTSLESVINKARVPKKLVSKNKKWVQLPQGYKSLRKFAGRQTGFKDLDYSGLLRQAYTFEVEDKTYTVRFGYAGGKTGRDGITPYQKMKFNEEREGKDIVAPSEEELDNFFTDIMNEVVKL